MNDLSESNVVQWIGKLFGVRTLLKGNFHRWLTARDYLYEHVSGLPEGLTQAELVSGRFNLLGSVWNMNSKSRLIEIGLEVVDTQGCGYLLVADAGLVGADSLFLAAISVDTDVMEAVSDNLYHMREWAALSAGPNGTGMAPSIVSGGLRMRDSRHFSVLAVRLSSLAQKYGLGEGAELD